MLTTLEVSKPIVTGRNLMRELPVGPSHGRRQNIKKRIHIIKALLSPALIHP